MARCVAPWAQSVSIFVPLHVMPSQRNCVTRHYSSNIHLTDLLCSSGKSDSSCIEQSLTELHVIDDFSRPEPRIDVTDVVLHRIRGITVGGGT